MNYGLRAATITGTQHARQIGTPTLNFVLPSGRLPTEYGIYAGRVTIENVCFPSVIHYGPRPFLGDPAPSLEAHLLDTSLAGQPKSATVEFAAYLRPIRNFSSEAALKDQISQDIQSARRALGAAR